jgi:hypothetical protein
VSTAILSDCGTYRYSLTRLVRPDDGTDLATCWRRVLFVLANPSTADAQVPDNTVTRCVGFTRSFKVFSSLEIVNPFAFRTKSPDVLMQAMAEGQDVVGPDNDAHIIAAAKRASLVICGWGGALRTKHPVVKKRVADVLKLLRQHHKQLYCLAKNKDGQPSHPLMLESDLVPQPWKEAA